MQAEQYNFEQLLAETHIAVVIPAYRVEAQIRRVIDNLPPYIRTIIVVDDRSPDATAEMVREAASPRVILVRHGVNQGVGGAMLTGYAVALERGAEIIVKMDGDDQMDAAYLPRLLQPILTGEADYTKGNRFMHTYALQRMPLMRRIGNFGLTFLTKLATGYWNMFDPNNGYTAIHSKVAQLINTDLIARRYFFESSMLLELRRLQAVVLDVPMPARYGDETSSLSLRRAFVGFPYRLMTGMFRRMVRQYFLFDFTAVSLFLLLTVPLLLFGTIWGAVNWYISAETGVPATTGTVLLAVLPIILGFQFLLQALVLDIAGVPQRVLHLHLPDPKEMLTHTASLSVYLDNQEIEMASEPIVDLSTAVKR